MAGPTAPTTAPCNPRPVARCSVGATQHYFTALVFGAGRRDRPKYRCARIADDRRRAGRHR